MVLVYTSCLSAVKQDLDDRDLQSQFSPIESLTLYDKEKQDSSFRNATYLRWGKKTASEFEKRLQEAQLTRSLLHVIC